MIRRRSLVLITAGSLLLAGLSASTPVARGRDGDDGLPCRGDTKNRLYDVALTYSNHREDPNRGAAMSSDFQQTVTRVSRPDEAV